ncbi:DNA polymerase III subunit delta [Candidatus Avelusimicrobium alvi]|uniref:DNA polymerase III subunit delta n=1 Tax=Candidatus Avelusimicrobium alvi TaxID=3416221 RepID=UPI003D13F001
MPKVTAEKLTAELEKNTVSPVYLLTGEDVYRKNLIIQKIRAVLHPDDFNSYQSEADKADLGEALALANTAPVFSDSRLIVLTGVEKLRKEPKEALIRYLDNPLPTTTLVLTHNDSKKMKTEKVLAEVCSDAGRVANFDELKKDELASWVRQKMQEKGLKADFDSVDLLCESVGGELNALANEIEKLYLYTAENETKNITKEDVLACIGFSKEENPFELSNAITACSKTRAVALVDKLIDDGEEPVGILSKMTFPILKMARIKRLSDAGMAPAEILRAAGLMYWENRLVSSARSFPPQKNFLNALNRIIDADSAFKSSTASDPKIVLKGILLTLFNK